MGTQLRSWALRMGLSAISILMIELVLRALVVPSSTSYGKLFGLDLPPLSLTAPSDSISPEAPKKNAPSLEDLSGLYRADPTTGYAYAENRISPQGWWRSNNIGASSAKPTSPKIPAGKKRILLFGDSYMRGSKMPISSSWPQMLQELRPGLEIVNLAVDGFGTGQSLSRFRQVQTTHDYDAVIFGFSPESDLWRDVNSLRYLGERWPGQTALPRFVVRSGELELISPPQENDSALRSFLSTHDLFYLPLLYESPKIIGRSMLYKVAAGSVGEWQRRRLFDLEKNDLNSEATLLTQKIFATAAGLAEKRGKKFILLLIPEPNVIFEIQAQPHGFRHQLWSERKARLEANGWMVLDSLPALLATPGGIDRGYDGTHFGIRANRVLADFVAAQLKNLP